MRDQMHESATLEEALERIEQITRSLEAGDTELEDSLALYEEGVRLIRRAEEAIRKAEVRIEQLHADGTTGALSAPPAGKEA